MADFCTCCAKQMGLPEPDIDIEKEAEDLQEGFYKFGYICEGCGLVAIGRCDGKIKVAMIDYDDYDDAAGDVEWKDFNPDFVSRAFRRHDHE